MNNRCRRAVLIATCCGLTVLMSKTLHLPETAISAYLIFFAAREETAETILIALALCVASVFAVGLAIVLIMATSGEPLLRILAMFAVAFVAMYLARATSVGVVAATLGMALFEVLSVMDFLSYPDLALRGLFWLLPVVFVPMAILALANLIFGAGARSLLNSRAQRRDALIASGASPEGRDACALEIARGNDEFYRLLRLARVAGTVGKHGAASLITAEDITQQKIALCAAGRMPNVPCTPNDTAVPTFHGATQDIRDSSGEALRFAVKSTLAIAVCYIIFVLLDWPAIHTITITAFLIALGSTAETLHKSALRLSGCLIGAAISGVCLLLIVPSLSSGAELAMLCAVVALPAAWVAVGPEKTAYAGMQVALVFLLSVANTTGPSVDLGIAWGRIVGIVLGNVVVAVVFLSIWPTDGIARIKELLSRATDRMCALAPAPGSGLTLGFVGQDVRTAREALEIAAFDPTAQPKELCALRRQADALAAQMISVYAGSHNPAPSDKGS